MKIKLLVLLFLISFSCSNNEWLTFESNKITLQFDAINFSTIQEDDYFFIDKIKIIHKKKFNQNMKNNTLILPSIEYIVKIIDKKEFKEKTNPFELAIRIHKYFKTQKSLYKINDVKFSQTLGEVSIERTDGKKIKIKKKKNYPLLIKIK